jgi:hypothetical protein
MNVLSHMDVGGEEEEQVNDLEQFAVLSVVRCKHAVRMMMN